MSSQFKLAYDQEVPAFHARFSRDAVGEVQDFVRISNGNRQKYFKTVINYPATGFEVYVAPKTFAVSPETHVTVECVSGRRYRWHKLFHDKNLRLALGGLVCSVISLSITASLAAGKVLPLIVLSTTVLSVLIGIALILQIVGAVLLLWKGVLESD